MRTSYLIILVPALTATAAWAEEKITVVVEDHPLLSVPFGFDFLSDGSLVVADYEGHRVSKVTRTGAVSGIAGDGQEGYQDGPGDRARFRAPHNVVVEASGDLLVSDTLNHCVRRIDGRTGAVSTVAGGPEKGYAGDVGPAREARFNQAYHVSPLENGFLLADLGNRRIRQVQDKTIRSIAGTGESAVPRDGARAADAPLVDPRAVARDQAGNVWILERSGHALRRLGPDGQIRTVAGTGKPGPASDGPALHCTLNGPKFLWIEPSGDVLIADTENDCIRRYAIQSGRLTTIAGTGKRGKGVPGGRPTATPLAQPHGVGVAPDGTIYIADSTNRRILRISQ